MNSEQGKLARLGIGFIIVILLGAVIWKLDLLKPEYSNASLSVTPANFDFGSISMAAGEVSTTVTLSNDGSESIKITDIRTSCMCTTATVDGITFTMHKNPAVNIVLKAGEKKPVLITFDPNAHGPEATGPITRVVFITTNSITAPGVEARISGNVVK